LLSVGCRLVHPKEVYIYHENAVETPADAIVLNENVPSNGLLPTTLRAISQYPELLKSILCGVDPMLLKLYEPYPDNHQVRVQLFNSKTNQFEICSIPQTMIFWEPSNYISLVGRVYKLAWPYIIENALIYHTKTLSDLYNTLETPSALLRELTGMGAKEYPLADCFWKVVLGDVIIALKRKKIVMVKAHGHYECW